MKKRAHGLAIGYQPARERQRRYSLKQ